jgi:hypothetical protein
MNYIIESIFVGVYTCTLSLLFSPFIKNIYILLLVVGFFKHFLGSGFGLWTWYCNNGEACLKTLSQDQMYEANTLYLLRESIYESIAFIFLGSILSYKLTNPIYVFFILGFSLHILAENWSIHKGYCKRTCDIVKTD